MRRHRAIAWLALAAACQGATAAGDVAFMALQAARQVERVALPGAAGELVLTQLAPTTNAWLLLSLPSPDGSGPAYAIEMALRHGTTNTTEVDYLNAHATSTGLGDVAETKAIKLAFGDYAKNGLMVSSTKSMTGHMLGAAGGIELIASVMAIHDGVIPPTINIDEQDPECDLDVVPNVAREHPVKVALSNSFGFGGHNASVLVRKFDI
jgi:3-oxoacyl-(acyl-carrier-protein) synthase